MMNLIYNSGLIDYNEAEKFLLPQWDCSLANIVAQCIPQVFVVMLL